MRSWFAVLGLTACRVADVDLEGRMCPCVAGFVCNPATNTCVRELPDAGKTPDAPTGPFGPPQPIVELNSATSAEDDPTATGDLLEIYFDSDRPGGALTGMGDIWVAKRSSTADPWGAPQLVVELASPADDTSPDISFDGLTMYFASDRAHAGDRDLYVTTRVTRSDPWLAPMRILELATTFEEGSAVETADRVHLVLSSTRNGSSDLFVSTRTAVGQPWSTPVPILGLSNPQISENQHHINADGTIVYYTSDAAAGVEHIFMATCDGPSGPCRDQQELPVINGSSTDVDPWVSPDGRTLLFSSQRSGNSELYMATR